VFLDGLSDKMVNIFHPFLVVLCEHGTMTISKSGDTFLTVRNLHGRIEEVLSFESHSSLLVGSRKREEPLDNSLVANQQEDVKRFLEKV
jgi:hypothetical protein